MAITISNLVKKYNDRTAIDHLSIEIGHEIFSFLGPNGAGKTTLVNIVCGLIERDSGEVEVAGVDPGKSPGRVRGKIGLVPQETALYEYLTATENLEFHARFYGVPRHLRKGKVQESLALAQLEDRANDRVSTFSGGMKRRLALVRSLLHDPEILILDEPTLGIDVQNRNEIWNRILKLKEQGKTIIVTTNYMDEADRLSDRCAILDHGKTITLDTPAQLKLKHAGGIKIEASITTKETEIIPELKSRLARISPDAKISERAEAGSYGLVMPARGTANQLLTEVSQVFQEFPAVLLHDLSLRVPTLDDVFLELTGSTLRD